MAKKEYNRIGVTLSDENYEMINKLVENNQKSIITKSAIVNVALTNLFKNATVDSIAKVIVEQWWLDKK